MHTREALTELRRAMAAFRRTGSVNRFHDKRVTLPVTTRVSHPKTNVLSNVGSTIQRDIAIEMVPLIKNDHESRNLKYLIRIVANRQMGTR